MVATLNLLKNISPQMEKCVIEISENPYFPKIALVTLAARWNKLISMIEDQWKNVLNRRLQIDLQFTAYVDCECYISKEKVEEYFPNCKIKEGSRYATFSDKKYIISRKIVLTKNFFVHIQMIVYLYYNHRKCTECGLSGKPIIHSIEYQCTFPLFHIPSFHILDMWDFF